MLAGATRTTADEEADEWAAKTFLELGLVVAVRFSAEAIIAFARVRAWEFLCARGSVNEESPRSLAAEFYGYYVASGYVHELGSWGGFDDYFAMLESGLIEGSVSDLIPGLVAELEELAGRKVPRLPNGSFRVATNLDQLKDLTGALAFQSGQQGCPWENSDIGSYGEALEAWLDDIRGGPWIVNNLGRQLPDEAWTLVRDTVREALRELPRTIGSLLTEVADGNVTGFSEDEFWLLSNAVLAAAIYE